MISTITTSRVACNHSDPSATPIDCSAVLVAPSALSDAVLRVWAAERGWVCDDAGDWCPTHRWQRAATRS